MRPAPRTRHRLAHSLSVVALAFWLGGAGCALCCAAPEASAAAALPAAEVNGAGAATANVPACHAQPRAESAASVDEGSAVSRQALRHSPSERRAGECCARALPRSDPARKPRPTGERADSRARRESNGPAVVPSTLVRERARTRSPDGRDTHVRCRVFLI